MLTSERTKKAFPQGYCGTALAWLGELSVFKFPDLIGLAAEPVKLKPQDGSTFGAAFPSERESFPSRFTPPLSRGKRR